MQELLGTVARDDAPNCAGDARGRAAARLRCVIDLLQSAARGDGELDARIDCVLNARRYLGACGAAGYAWCDDDRSEHGGTSRPAAAWSVDLAAGLSLIPPDHNYSLGSRDGVCWAWIQPNDDWAPGPHAMRHDHPRGSSLIVAATTALAVSAAALTIRLHHC